MATINRDPEITRYLNRAVDEHAFGAFFRIVTARWERHGFGFYAVESLEADSPVLVGFVGVAYRRSCPSSPSARSSAGG